MTTPPTASRLALEERTEILPEWLESETTCDTGLGHASPELPLLPRGRVGPFRVEGVLGRGGFATVFRARRGGDATPVALKVFDPEVVADPELWGRCRREVSILLDLEAPHVVRALAAGEADGHAYLALELLDGLTARELLGDQGSLEVEAVQAIARGLTQALAVIHERGLVHRDVKPDNVVLTSERGATLIDFGLAKRCGDQDLTLLHELPGTVGYLAPELVTGEPAHPGSDLYGLGVMLFELLTGRRPYRGTTIYELLERIATSAHAPRVDELRPEVPRPLADFVAALMDPDPAARPRGGTAAREARDLAA